MGFVTLMFLSFGLICIRGDELFKPCDKEDLQCLRAATQTFLSKTYAGHTKLGIKPIDPLIVQSVDVSTEDDLGVVFHFKNLNITGLKNLEVSDFKLDKDKNLGRLEMKVPVSIVGDIEVEMTNYPKTLKGSYTASANILGISEYSVSLRSENNKQYFVLGSETTQCEVLGEPTVTIGSELQNDIDNDQHASSLKISWEPKKTALRKKALCAIVQHGFTTILHNLKAIANVFDKTAFFTNL